MPVYVQLVTDTQSSCSPPPVLLFARWRSGYHPPPVLRQPPPRAAAYNPPPIPAARTAPCLRTNARKSFPNRGRPSAYDLVTSPPPHPPCPPLTCVRSQARQRTPRPADRSSSLSSPLHDPPIAGGHLGWCAGLPLIRPVRRLETCDPPPAGGHPDLPPGPIQSCLRLSRRHNHHITNSRKNSAFACIRTTQRISRARGRGQDKGAWDLPRNTEEGVGEGGGGADSVLLGERIWLDGERKVTQIATILRQERVHAFSWLI